MAENFFRFDLIIMVSVPYCGSCLAEFFRILRPFGGTIGRFSLP
jgi:hypothetical protein